MICRSKKVNHLNAGIAEFSAYSYCGSSTNRIVTHCGISKGSLFQYFQNKEDFYIVDTVTAELMAELANHTAALPLQLFQKAAAYAALKFGWYLRNPAKYKLILNAFAENDTDMRQKIAARYAAKGERTYDALLQDIDVSQLKGGKAQTLDILKWFLNGFNKDFINKMPADTDADASAAQREYINSLTEHFTLLQTGLLK